MRSLHKRGERAHLAAWRPRTSRLGVAYMLALTLAIGLLYRIIFTLFIFKHECGDMWDVWLTGWNQNSSLFQIITAMFVLLFMILAIDFGAYLRSKNPNRLGTIICYLFMLAFPLSALWVCYVFYGAMIPTSEAHNAYLAISEIVQDFYNLSLPEDVPSGPLGSCVEDIFYLPNHWQSHQPNEIGAL